MNKSKAVEHQNIVLKILSGKIDEFYLAGGTALSLFYFQHRLSFDLDFFTPDFSIKRINEIISLLNDNLKKEIKLTAQSLKKDKMKMQVYNIYFTKKDILKIDFVEDSIKLIKETKEVDKIRVLSLEDIYLRKLYAVAGMTSIDDFMGRKKFIGGRVEAKDFYDLYFLSHTFIPLSKFVDKHLNSALVEGLIVWFRTYDRMRMMDGVLDIDTEKKIDYKKMENHFNEEIDRIIKREIL